MFQLIGNRHSAQSSYVLSDSTYEATLETQNEQRLDERSTWTWRVFISVLASMMGIGISIYLTIAHYLTTVSLSCPNTGAINCEKVTTSAQSLIFGIPVADLGLVFFIPMFALSLPWAWRSQNERIAPLRLGMAVTGVAFVFHLVYAELFNIHAICLWCSGVHIMALILFVAVVTGWEEATKSWRSTPELAEEVATEIE